MPVDPTIQAVLDNFKSGFDSGVFKNKARLKQVTITGVEMCCDAGPDIETQVEKHLEFERVHPVDRENFGPNFVGDSNLDCSEFEIICGVGLDLPWSLVLDLESDGREAQATAYLEKIEVHEDKSRWAVYSVELD